VDKTFFATGGIRLGGQGTWRKGPAPRCRLEIVTAGLTEYLDRLTLYMTGWFAIGLFQNDREPKLDDAVGNYQEATFSGYSGSKLLYGWTNAAMRGVRAKSFATPLIWKHNGGPIANDVYGYFCINNVGALAFAERFCDGPITVDRRGRSVNLTPMFSAKNEREED